MASPVVLLIFGILGNMSSIFSYLAPLPTFVEIRKRKSTLGYHSVPYVVSLLNSMVWLYYALSIRTHPPPLIIVNSIGCFIETIYIFVYLAYAPTTPKNRTLKLLGLSLGLFASILVFSMLIFKTSSTQVAIIGWCCVAVNIAGFAAPLTVAFQVIRTKSVEYMSFTLSFSLTLNAAIWFSYGVARHDLFLEIPNICGIILGVLQMMLYGACRYANRYTHKNGEIEGHIDIVVLGTPEVHPIETETTQIENDKSEIKIFEDGADK